VGAPVEVHVLALPDQVFKAKLSYVAATVDPTTHRLPVRAEVENPDDVLKPEMFANFNIITGDDTQSLAVPENAVVYEGAAAHVWLAKPDKTIALRNIQVGHVNNGMVEVLDGLKPDDAIVTSGALFIDRAAAGD
jgi:cobalt-zinc-cadmium efflux system membrane fusion protein